MSLDAINGERNCSHERNSPSMQAKAALQQLLRVIRQSRRRDSPTLAPEHDSACLPHNKSIGLRADSDRGHLAPVET